MGSELPNQGEIQALSSETRVSTVGLPGNSLKVKITQSYPTLCDPHGLYSLWNSPGQNTGVGSLSLLQQIFLTKELNWGLLHCKRILYQLSYQGSHWKWFQAENKNLYSVNHVYLQSQEIHLNRWIRQILFILSNDGSKEQTQYIWYAI